MLDQLYFTKVLSLQAFSKCVFIGLLTRLYPICSSRRYFWRSLRYLRSHIPLYLSIDL